MEGSHSTKSTAAIFSKWAGLMESLKAFYETTVQLIELLKNDALDRDIRIEKIQNLLDRREEILKSIHPPFSQPEEELGRQLVELNHEVDKLLQNQKQDIQQDIKQLNIQKKSNHKYTNPYKSLSIDGVFYDKRN